MKELLSILLIGIVTFAGVAQDSIDLNVVSEEEYISDSAGKQAIDAYANYGMEENEVEISKDSVEPVERQQSEKSLEQQAEEIPVVFGQWWFWVGFFAIILFLKFVIFKK